jgi:DNA-binding XRE family transcriptional regulator
MALIPMEILFAPVASYPLAVCYLPNNEHRLTPYCDGSVIVGWMLNATAVRQRLGKRVRTLREKKKWSQEELAHRGSLARSFTGAIERGEKDLRLTMIVKLANTFRIPIDKLFK